MMTEREVSRALSRSDKACRKKLYKGNKIANRYITRALANRLPTYENEEKLRAPGNSYDHIILYGDMIAGGICKLCDQGEPETLRHIMCECTAGQAAAGVYSPRDPSRSRVTARPSHSRWNDRRRPVQDSLFFLAEFWKWLNRFSVP